MKTKITSAKVGKNKPTHGSGPTASLLSQRRIFWSRRSSRSRLQSPPCTGQVRSGKVRSGQEMLFRLKCSSVRRKPPGEQWSPRGTEVARRGGILTWKWTLGPVTMVPTIQKAIPNSTTASTSATTRQPRIREAWNTVCTQKALRIRASCSEIGRTFGC